MASGEGKMGVWLVGKVEGVASGKDRVWLVGKDGGVASGER